MLVSMCFARGIRLQFDAAVDVFSGPLVGAWLCRERRRYTEKKTAKRTPPEFS
jgi:hypothetical protein